MEPAKGYRMRLRTLHTLQTIYGVMALSFLFTEMN